MLVASWKYFFTWNTQNIIWEKFKSLEYLLNMSPSFREHFVFNQDVFLLFEFVSLSVFVMSEFIMFLTQWYIL